jgi:glycosyltransferase involved in cell wall biosynthesis
VFLLHGREFDERHYRQPMPGLTLVAVDQMVHPIAPWQDIKAVAQMAQLMRQLRPDVVHTHQSKAGILGRMAAFLARVPVIIHGVHIVPFENVGAVQRLVYLGAEKLMGQVTDAFINVSRGTRDLYLQARIGPATRHHVVHSGFDLSRFKGAQAPDDWRELLGLQPGEDKPPVIVMLAALEERKRHCEFLEVFGEVVRQVPQVRLVMPGEGPHRAAVQATIARLGLERHALLVGFRTDPERLIALADLGILTSTREGLPRVIMQYLAVGKPVVATHLPGLEEVVSDGINGHVLPPDDLAGAAATVVRLLTEPAALARLAQGARQTDLSSWDVHHMGRKMQEAYASCTRQMGMES